VLHLVPDRCARLRLDKRGREQDGRARDAPSQLVLQAPSPRDKRTTDSVAHISILRGLGSATSTPASGERTHERNFLPIRENILIHFPVGLR
jgi:hypothetical protein